VFCVSCCSLDAQRRQLQGLSFCFVLTCATSQRLDCLVKGKRWRVLEFEFVFHGMILIAGMSTVSVELATVKSRLP